MLGLAIPGVQNVVLQAEAWQSLYEAEPADDPDLQPFLRDGEPTPEEQAARIESALDVLRGELRRYQPQAVIVVCPRSGAATGPVSSFSLRLPAADLSPSRLEGTEYTARRFGLARRLLNGLVAAGIDLAWEGVDGAAGADALDVCVKALGLGSDVSIVPLFVNTSVAPMPSAARCIELGAALGTCLQKAPERVAVVAVGGLSADELGRWIDEPLDRWFLDWLSKGDLAPLRKLFLFETAALNGRTGELRTWLTVAAACGGSAKVIDYLPSRQAKTALAFATWPGA